MVATPEQVPRGLHYGVMGSIVLSIISDGLSRTLSICRLVTYVKKVSTLP